MDFFKELASKSDSYRTENIERAYDEEYISYEQAIKSLKKIVDKDEKIYILPLYIYDHSGVTMNTTGFNCGWDSSAVGYVYTTKEDLDKLGCIYESEEDVEKILKTEVKLYDTYLRGEVFGYKVVEYDEEYDNEYYELTSCWGFYGSNMEENGMICNLDLTEEQKKEVLVHGTDVYKYLC